ncbi:MAG TPA: GTP-binding protein [Mycobacteriales bacterium]|nr:GTP-binding protein [Mycobacteriales bacterium]
MLTLLSGTSASLRSEVVRVLTEHRPGLVAVEYALDTAPDGLLVRTVLDAAGAHDVTRVEPVGCCLSCTVRADAPEAVRLVDDAERWSEVVVALPSAVRPGELADLLEHEDLPVAAVAVAVDARLLLEQVRGDDLLAERGMAAAPTDRRSTAELVLGQLDDADVVLLAELHRAGTDTARTVEALLAHLSPLALQLRLAPDASGCEELLAPGRRSRTTQEERQQLATLARELCPPACGVATVVWQSERPLHSGRLHAVLGELVSVAVRSRGHVWLADRARWRLRWEQAGGSLSLGDPQRWTGLPGCELVLTGVGLDAAEVSARLDGCLATDDELADPGWPDPFEAALGPAEDVVR